APEVFYRNSVDLVPGANWGDRFHAAIARAQLYPPITGQQLLRGSVYYNFANEVMLGLACLRAQQLDSTALGLAVWDGQRGDGPFGTSGAIDLWRKHRLEWRHIDLDALRRAWRPDAPPKRTRPVSRPPRPRVEGPQSRVRFLLFADVRHFSKMSEEAVRPFVVHGLGLLARLAARPDSRPIGREPRGDGAYLVFATAESAGRLALRLTDALRRTRWVRFGLPEDMTMRIGLHAGPVQRMRDPLTHSTLHIGTHVNRAARIEPVTPPGQVYASQEFAALAVLEGAEA